MLDKVKKLLLQIKDKNFKSIYFLYGENDYYIKNISSFIVNTALDTQAKEFDLTVFDKGNLHSKQITLKAKQSPMMGVRQVIVIKDAKEIKESKELELYAKNPQKSTILIFHYNKKSIDKKLKELSSLINKNYTLFECRNLYQNEIIIWIKNIVRTMGHKITDKASNILFELIGNNMSSLKNELDKINISTEKSSIVIDENTIMKNVNFNKDYNYFELRDSLVKRNKVKIYSIINHFSKNTKIHPPILTLNWIFNFFYNLLLYLYLDDKSLKNVSLYIKEHPYSIQNYAKSKYEISKVRRIINEIIEAELKLKGVKVSLTKDTEIIRELILKIF